MNKCFLFGIVIYSVTYSSIIAYQPKLKFDNLNSCIKCSGFAIFV
jgi:hypothetical protein